MNEIPEIATLVPRFGSNRMNRRLPGELLGPCKWIGVPFCGGLCEVPFLQAPAIVCNDLDRDVINLAECVKTDRQLICQAIDDTPFHPDTLALCQKRCREWQKHDNPEMPNVFHAVDYFVSCWMARNDSAGTDKELDASLSIRWNGNGGDSNKRFRNAAASLEAWGRVMRSCSFTCMDALAFLEKCSDLEQDRCGIYVDAPWPDDGDSYKHKFGEDQQRKLAAWLLFFNTTRIVVRFGEHPMVRDLYPECHWTWRPVESRTQANGKKQEWLLTNF